MASLVNSAPSLPQAFRQTLVFRDLPAKVNFGQTAAVEPDFGVPARNRPSLSPMTTAPADARQHRR